MANGKGRQIYGDNNIYEGNFENNNFHGFG